MLHPTLHALVERNLLLCVGPLVAEAAGLAGPHTLALRAIEALDDTHPSRGLWYPLLAAGEVAHALSRAEELLTGPRFVGLMRAALEQRDVRLPLVVRAIARLSPQLRYLCTTNLDSLLERALEFKWTAFDRERPDLKGRPRSIMKMCGSVEQVSSWVLTERRLADRPAELPQVGCMLRSHVLVLIGYRADDELLRRLVLPLRGRMSPAWPAEAPGSLALVPADSVTPGTRALFDDHGIELVPISGDYDVSAAEWLHGLAAAYQDATQHRLRADLDDLDEFAARYGIPEPPYPGLRPYEGGRSRFLFCGRERDVERALDQVRARPSSRWLIVHGEHGIGKSSFVAAGLLPRILRDSVTRDSGGWTAMVGGSGLRPLRSLVDGLFLLYRSRPGLRGWSETTLFDHLQATPHALSDLIENLSPRGFVLVIDSLDFGLEDTERTELEAFSAALAYALAHARVPFLLITTHRSERLVELQRLPQLHERTLGLDPPVYYGLGPLGIEQLCQVILRPAARAGISVPERLVTRLITDYDRLMGGVKPPSPGFGLAMFNAALAETFRRSTLRELSIEAYEAAGGIEGAINSAAEASLERAVGDWSETSVRLLIPRLVGTDTKGRELRNVLSPAEAVHIMMPAFAGYTPRVQQDFAERMLARLTEQNGVGQLVALSSSGVHLLHDALLSQWARLRWWRVPDEGRTMRTGLSRLPADPPRPEAVTIAAASQSQPTRPPEPVRPLKLVPNADPKSVTPSGSQYWAFTPRSPWERTLALGLLILAASLALFALYAFFTAPQSPVIQTSALAPGPEHSSEADPARHLDEGWQLDARGLGHGGFRSAG